MLRFLWLTFILFQITVYGQIFSPQQPKSCGTNSIPFEFRVDKNGVPEIQCNTPPTCFGAQDFDQSFDDADDDGYAYGNRNFTAKRRHKKSINVRNIECTGRFSEEICSSKDEWTAGIQEYNNGTHYILKAECCRYNGLNDSTTDSQTYSIRNGENFAGGEVFDKNGKVVAFDFIKEVRKNIDTNNEAIYLVTVNRMTCSSQPDPTEYRNPISPYAENDGYESQDFGITGGYRGRRSYPEEEYIRPSYYSNHHPNRRYHPIRRNSYPPHRQIYGPIFDEYDNYDFEPIPLNRRRSYPRRYVSRYDPEQYYPSNGRPRAYAAFDGYSNPQPEPLQEYQEVATLSPYQDINNKISLIRRHQKQPQHLLFPPPQQPLTGFLQPPPPLTFLQPPPQLPQLPQIGSQLTSNPSSQPSADSTTCIGLHCRKPANAFASQIMDLNDFSGQQLQQQPQQPQQLQQFSPGYSQSGENPGQQYPGYSSQSASQQYSPSYSQSSDSSCQQCPTGNSGGGCCNDLNSAFSSMQCFSGDMTVQTPSGMKRMDELEVGDMVLSIEQAMISYTPVVMFLHNDPKEAAVFKEIETADNQIIKLTEFHLIYVTSCQPEPYKLIHAKDVKVGQCIHALEEFHHSHSMKAVEVIAIRGIEETGIYAPLTASGDLIVNSVLASCHSNMGIQTLQQTFFTAYRKINVAFTSMLNMFGIVKTSETGSSLPFGVQYLTSVLDVIVPKTFLS